MESDYVPKAVSMQSMFFLKCKIILIWGVAPVQLRTQDAWVTLSDLLLEMKDLFGYSKILQMCVFECMCVCVYI